MQFYKASLPALLCAFFACFCLLAAVDGARFVPNLQLPTEDPFPKWPLRFYVEFNETASFVKTNGKWWYDAVNGVELVERDIGKGDRYCGSVYPFKETPCRHIVTEGKRYLDFPNKNYCCMCCNSSQGCGIVSPTWLNDAEYQGRAVVNDILTYKWLKKGLQSNYYYATADEHQIPIELDQWPNAFQFFHKDTFVTKPTDPSLVHVPDYCVDKCPFYSVCTLL